MIEKLEVRSMKTEVRSRKLKNANYDAISSALEQQNE